jgi:hypothetical protein
VSIIVALNEIGPMPGAFRGGPVPAPSNWFAAQFPYNKQFIEFFKQIPGANWDSDTKRWKIPAHALPALHRNGIEYRILSRCIRSMPTVLPALAQRLRPYQQEDVQRMLNEPAFILAYDPRVGKTPTASVGMASALAFHTVRTAVILYPNQVREEWERQFPFFTNGCPLVCVDGTRPFDPAPYSIEKMPYLAIGMHYELLRAADKGEEDFKISPIVREVLNLIYRRGPYLACADEPHLIVKRKSPRAQLFMRIGHEAAIRWCLDGTPLRSRPRDMYPIWEFLQKDSMGSYSKYTVRYADGHAGDHGWVDKGTSNPDELQGRLHSIWIKRTRREVAPWLPKADRRIILCDMTAAQRKLYAAQETALGPEVLKAINDAGGSRSLDALRALADSVSSVKMPTMMERVRYHVEDRKVKILVFALHHETIQKAWQTILEAGEMKETPFKNACYVAGGWLQPPKRREAIAAWKADPKPAVLLVNSLSSGIGIDLADADAAIGLEAAWVPADFTQMEARIEDVHLGKRTTPPLLEYILCRNTIDEDMVSKLILKLGYNEQVTGGDAVSRQIDDSLRNAGVVDRSKLSLAREDDETVSNALEEMLKRIGTAVDEDPSVYDTGDNAEVVEDAEDDSEDADEDGD